MHEAFPPRLTTGEECTGNQQYKGYGIQRYCALCECHKATGGGSFKRVMGLSQWVCKQHPKAQQ